MSSTEQYPLLVDATPFGQWLRCQIHRQDPVGALARVATHDPYWPGGTSRASVQSYFQKMGAREFVMNSVKLSWDEFDQSQRRDRTVARRKAEKAARRKQQKINRARRRK